MLYRKSSFWVCGIYLSYMALKLSLKFCKMMGWMALEESLVMLFNTNRKVNAH